MLKGNKAKVDFLVERGLDFEDIGLVLGMGARSAERIHTGSGVHIDVVAWLDELSDYHHEAAVIDLLKLAKAELGEQVSQRKLAQAIQASNKWYGARRRVAGKQASRLILKEV